MYSEGSGFNPQLGPVKVYTCTLYEFTVDIPEIRTPLYSGIMSQIILGECKALWGERERGISPCVR